MFALISVVQAVFRYGHGGCYRQLPAEVPAPIPCEKHELVTGITVRTVAPRTVPAAAVEQDTMGLVASKVNLFYSARNNMIRWFASTW